MCDENSFVFLAFQFDFNRFAAEIHCIRPPQRFPPADSRRDRADKGFLRSTARVGRQDADFPGHAQGFGGFGALG